MAKLVASLRGLREIEWLRTGIHAIDLIMGAGIPRGRLVEVIGDPATTKTAFALEVIAAFQRAGGTAIYLEPEVKLDRKWAVKLGVDVDNMGYEQPADLAELMRIVGRVAQTANPKVPTVVAVDTLAATPGVDELEELVSEEGMGKEKAAHARYISAALRALMLRLSQQGVTFLVVNQLRTKFNFFTKTTGSDSFGGRAVKYYAAIRLKFRYKGRLHDKTRDVDTGIALEAEAIKNACACPFRHAEVLFRFDGGFVRRSGLDELLIRHGRLTASEGWLCYGDRKFRASEIESVAAEEPGILAPIDGVMESPVEKKS